MDDPRGRAIETTLPLSVSTHRTRYTEDGLLQRIERGTAAGTREPVYEAEEFDHLGRPRRVRQVEAVRTAFTYEVITERLLGLQTTASGRALQDLHYAYDPVGNITQVRDGAQAVGLRKSEDKVEEEGAVSMWQGHTESEGAFKKAIEVEFSEDGDFLGSAFSRAFGIEYYDEGVCEGAVFDTPRTSLAQVVAGASYEDLVLPRLESLGVSVEPGTNCVVLLYNYRHVAPPSASLPGVTLVFKGAVSYV